MSDEQNDEQSRDAPEDEQVRRASSPGPEPATRHDASGERVPEPYPDEHDDESAAGEDPDEVAEQHRRGADEIERHGGHAADQPQHNRRRRRR